MPRKSSFELGDKSSASQKDHYPALGKIFAYVGDDSDIITGSPLKDLTISPLPSVN